MKSTRRRSCLAALGLLCILLSIALPTLAAEDNENPAEAPIGMVFRWLNFALVFGGLGYLIAKKAPAFFRGRADAISASIAEAAAAQADAEKHLREAEEKLLQVDREVAELRAAARRESAAEAERIRALARSESEKIARAAQLEVEAAERAARIELKAMAARLAVERADALIRRQMTTETQAALFHSFLNDLARSAN
jgi:F0F1-type ATP synthase membrane subunit b/b'